jgi:hypothetical protein
MHTLPYIPLPALLVKKDEKHCFYKKMRTSEGNSKKNENLQKEAEGLDGYYYIRKGQRCKGIKFM